MTLSPVDLRAFADLLGSALLKLDSGDLRPADGSPLIDRQNDLLARATIEDLTAGKALPAEDMLRAQVDFDAHHAFAELVCPVMTDGEDWADAIKRLPADDQRRAWDLAVAAGYAEVAR